ncbi:flavin reductase family protein [Streptosporangium sp. NBC_01756]|uniref:flavin reductase family protein n=1 Tax=Streptosporangium sp. NBC_01756 TaxID=2975950 RepID=UPI002DD89ADF|nr:flavin reductase family protein [Streptosporangium sp. NBC_01756]WSC85762.1 flavin reductase family protein [Streptosporangium sp. NBC_01756]
MDVGSFRDALSQWASGVTVVTTAFDGLRHGMTASSFSGVALDPPLVSVCLTTAGATHRMIEHSGVFAVSILGHDHGPVGRHFAGVRNGHPDGAGRFSTGRWETAGTGSPVLGDAVGWFDCRVAQTHAAGDHTIVLGEVLTVGTPRNAPPLIYHARLFHDQGVLHC